MFQIHLWTGIGVGLYIVVASLSGSAVVFRRELMRAFANRPQVSAHDATTHRLDRGTSSAPRRVARIRTTPSRRSGSAATANARRHLDGRAAGIEKKHLFDPYTGADLGETIPPGVRTLDWLVSLHDDLLGGFTGRTVNGVGAIVARRAVHHRRDRLVAGHDGVAPRSDRPVARRLEAHELGSAQRDRILDVSRSCFMWAVSGIYLVFPHPFMAVVDFLEPLDPASLDAAPRRPRARVAREAAFRTVRRHQDEDVVGDHGPHPAGALRHRRADVVEPRVAAGDGPRLAQEAAVRHTPEPVDVVIQEGTG